MSKLSFKLKVPLPKLDVIRLPGSNASVHFSASGMAIFDRNVIKTNWSAINRGPLRRAGLLTRKIMRRSIRKVKSDQLRYQDYLAGKTKNFRKGKPSKPGTPPRSRNARLGHPFKLIYSVPVGDDRVIVGHVGFKPGRQTPMSMHEFGESATIKTPVFSRRRRVGKRRRGNAEKLRIAQYYKQNKSKNSKATQYQTRTVKMPKRPFARPAVEKASPQFAKMWKNSVPTIKAGVGR